MPTLAPPFKLVRDTSDQLRVLRSIAILCTLSKSDCVVLIAWAPSGDTPVVPECPDRAVLFTNPNVTACQCTRGHLERTENPWICYITVFFYINPFPLVIFYCLF